MAKSTQEKGKASTPTGSGLMKKRPSNTTPTRRRSLPPNSPTTPIDVDGDEEADTHRREVRSMDLRGCKRAFSTLHASFIGRKILRTRRLDFNFFELIRVWVRYFFHRIGWDGFVNTKEPLCERYVCQFYGNLQYIDPAKPLRLESSIDGKIIKVTPNVIRTIFNIPKGAFHCYESKWWPSVVGFDAVSVCNMLTGRSDIFVSRPPRCCEVTIESRLIHRQIIHGLVPRIGSGSFSRMTFYEVFLVWSIVTGKSVDLAYIIVRYMLKASMDPKSALLYGNHLGKLFATVGLVSPTPPRTGRGKNQNIDMIGVRSLLNMNYEFIFGDWVLVKTKKNESKKIRQEENEFEASDMKEPNESDGSTLRYSEDETEYAHPNEPTEDEDTKYESAKKDAVMDDEMLERLKNTMKHFLDGKMVSMEARLTVNVTNHNKLVEARLGALERGITTYGNELTKEVKQLKMKLDQPKDVGPGSGKPNAGHGSTSMEF
ncbi:hypothetical protein Scep_014829 [Stephania cephalantha]|uniref:Putative plant transposon protein domain-containing protein n=1 Tax=Stephania cephalantha TaxID=152367 RepID=A0AAP0J229_9MAGN